MNRTFKTGRFAAKLAAATLFAATCQAQAAELLVTPAMGKGGAMSVALDIVAAKDEVSGFQFTLNLGKGAKGQANLSKCASALPSGFTGHCRQNGNKIVFFVLADRMTTLPEGVISVGSISFNAGAAPKAAMTVEEMEFVDVKGSPISASSRVE
jgi:hypothetical protein